MPSHRPSTSLKEVLLRRGLLTADALKAAEEETDSGRMRLERLLVDRRIVSGPDMLLSVAEYLRIPPIGLSVFMPDPDLLALADPELLAQLQVVPICRSGNHLFVAMGDPFNIAGVETLHARTGLEISPLVAEPREVSDLIDKHVRPAESGLEEVLKDVQDVEVDVDQKEDVSLDEMKEQADEAPVIRLVNSIMIEALRKRVSDIHIEAMEKTMRLRYRVDGMLYENPSPPKRLHSAICSRIKILSNLNIAERRVPQDGRFKIKALGREADVRVSVLPTVHGEKIVMRILDKTQLAPSLDALGLDPLALENFKYAISQPHGMLLVTGPTGSGKTTTLYSCLQDLNTSDVNIITTEDPVEYQLGGVNQVQVHSEIGLTFAASLRSILRQDPDIVMVGEIRDGETALIAVQAALTGHLVLSTLHTNDAAGAVARMVNMGIEPFLLASSLLMTQAQRLYRRVCPTCRQVAEFPAEVLRLNHLDPEKYRDAVFYEARGCPKCNNLGYRGRGALMEILMMNDAVRAQMLRDSDASKIRDIAVSNGMLTLRDVGMNKVREGLTTLEEILRVTSGD
jgi:type IV pilus assembly protein PilB